MILGGLQKLTLIDFPGRIAATVFTVGCNFSCPFCHNPDLVDAQKILDAPKIEEKDFFDFLKNRQGMLEGVCVTGGEPTLNRDLPEFLAKIKELGFLVKLDTNGTNPALVEKLLKKNLVDYIAMDIKAPLEKYKEVVGPWVSLEDIQRSVELTRSLPEYEFRTTVLPALHSKKDLLGIGRWLQGSKRYFLQQFRPQITLDEKFASERPFDDKTLAEIRQSLAIFFDECGIRE